MGREINHLDLFSGIGGFALAARWSGFNTIAFCEIDKFCQKVLKKNFPGKPIIEDIRSFDVAKIKIKPDVITGGYPCQPFSSAGKRRGKDDDRHLWPEMLRVIQGYRPSWVICENVFGHVSMGLDEVLVSLESENYTCWPFIIPASAVGAPHKRDRVWVIANSNSDGLQGVNSLPGKEEGGIKEEWNDIARVACKVCEGRGHGVPSSWIVGKNTGIPSRVDRTRGLGNAIVPQVAYRIFECIKMAGPQEPDANK